jgi:hypothetical protein
MCTGDHGLRRGRMSHKDTSMTTAAVARSFGIKRPRLTKLLDESEARVILLVALTGH